MYQPRTLHYDRALSEKEAAATELINLGVRAQTVSHILPKLMGKNFEVSAEFCRKRYDAIHKKSSPSGNHITNETIYKNPMLRVHATAFLELVRRNLEKMGKMSALICAYHQYRMLMPMSDASQVDLDKLMMAYSYYAADRPMILLTTCRVCSLPTLDLPENAPSLKRVCPFCLKKKK